MRTQIGNDYVWNIKDIPYIFDLWEQGTEVRETGHFLIRFVFLVI